jgi:hypothetical protein
VERTPDDRWIRAIEDVVFDPGGGMAVLAPPWVMFYPAALDGTRMLSIDGCGLDARRLHCGADWLLLSSWQRAVVLVRRSTGELFTFAPAAGDGSSSWAHGLSADGKRLLCLDARNRRLHRFALP